MQFVLFTDNLADLSVPEVCRGVKKAGFDGLDLTLRPGGHVRPDRAETGLAEAHRIAADQGLSIPMITTAITDASSPHAEAIFAAAAHYGARHIKLGYWTYEPFGTAEKQLNETRRKLERLVRLGEKYHVLPCVHCHSGRVITGGGIPLYMILRDFRPDQAGAYVDPMHMAVEGGLNGWELALDLLAPWAALVGLKNFRWIAPRTTRDAFGQQRYEAVYCPVADGQAPLPEFFQYLARLQYDGVVSLHSEYKSHDSFRQLSTSALLDQSAVDLAYTKKLVAAVAAH